MAKFKKVLRDSSYMGVSKLLSRLVYTFFLLYAAAKLGPSLFGALSFAIAVVELLSSMGDLGITRYGSRELVRRWDDRAVVSGQILTIQVASSFLISLGGAFFVIFFDPASPKYELLMLGFAVILVSSVISTTESLYIAGQQFFYSAIFTLVGRLIYAGIGFAVVASGGSVVIVMWGLLAAVIIESVCRLVFIFKAVTVFSFRFQPQSLWRMISASIPFSIGAVAAIFFLQSGVIILQFLEDDTAVGIFSLALSLFLPMAWVAIILTRTTFPGMAELYMRDKAASRINAWQWLRFIILVGIPSAIAVILLVGPVLSHFPASYQQSKTVLIILSIAIPFQWVAGIEINMLQIADLERQAALILTVTALFNVMANFVLIPLMGVKGAAVAYLLSVVVREVQVYATLYRHFMHRHTLILYLKPLLGGAVMFGLALLLWGFNPWLATGAGLVAYSIFILTVGGVRPAEIRQVMKG